MYVCIYVSTCTYLEDRELLHHIEERGGLGGAVGRRVVCLPQRCRPLNVGRTHVAERGGSGVHAQPVAEEVAQGRELLRSGIPSGQSVSK